MKAHCKTTHNINHGFETYFLCHLTLSWDNLNHVTAPVYTAKSLGIVDFYVSRIACVETV